MRRRRFDQGIAGIPPTGEDALLSTTYVTPSGTLEIKIKVGELELEVILPEDVTRDYLEANHLLFTMLSDE